MPLGDTMAPGQVAERLNALVSKAHMPFQKTRLVLSGASILDAPGHRMPST